MDPTYMRYANPLKRESNMCISMMGRSSDVGDEENSQRANLLCLGGETRGHSFSCKLSTHLWSNMDVVVNHQFTQQVMLFMMILKTLFQNVVAPESLEHRQAKYITLSAHADSWTVLILVSSRVLVGLVTYVESINESDLQTEFSGNWLLLPTPLHHRCNAWSQKSVFLCIAMHATVNHSKK